MKGKRIFLSLLLAVSLIISMAFTVTATDNPNVVIRDLLNHYRHYGSDSLTDVYRLLDELEKIDADQADNWRKVMDRWDYAVNHLNIPFGCLPDGLPEDDSLCIVVMGFMLNPNGTMREELIGRCQVALNSHKKYPNAYIICTGGGTASGNSYTTEADQMAKWLIDHGVEESRVLIENRSVSTEQNATNSMDILKQQYPQVDSLALISSDYHIRRCFVLFEAALALNDWEDDYRILSTAGYDTPTTITEGLKIEAESIGLMVDLYVSSMEKPQLSLLEGLLVEGETAYTTGEELKLQVSAMYNTDVSRDVTDLVVCSGYDMAQPGTQEVTVEYTENEVTLTKTLQITVDSAPAETTLPPTEVPETEAEIPASAEENADAPVKKSEKDAPTTPPIWILLIPLILALVLILKVMEMVQRKRRRRRRPRKKMEWE